MAWLAARRRAEDDRLAGLVEAERKRLLREAAELKDFLPRGVLRDQGDVDYIAQVRSSDVCPTAGQPQHRCSARIDFSRVRLGKPG